MDKSFKRQNPGSPIRGPKLGIKIDSNRIISGGKMENQKNNSVNNIRILTDKKTTTRRQSL